MTSTTHYRKRRIEFVASEEEHREWSSMAKKAGISLGELIRRSLGTVEKITITRKAS